MSFKGILKYILFLLFFIGDIALIFSDKGIENTEKYNTFPIPISYQINNDLSGNDAFHSADSIFASFLIKYKINGASVAIAKDGKLVMAKGYGYANIENNHPVEPRHVFRIASVSKLITAVAIMKLQEEGKLSVNDKVFGKDGILNDSAYLNIADKRVYDINVHHLLNHSGGWSKKKPDPMFSYFSVARELDKPLPVSVDDIIQYALTKKVDYQPGSKSSYSNLGYAILGKVIEKLSGMDYEKYVKDSILFPLEIYDMHIAKSFSHQRRNNEVTYYESGKMRIVPSFDGSGKYVPKAYGGNNMEILAATGGWVSSPSELMKLLLAIDGFESRPDILSDESINLMVNCDDLGVPYGWKGIHKGFWWRTGTLTGTSALAARQSNEISWIVLFNTSPKRATRFPRYVHQNMNKMLSSIKKWPEYDLFQYDIKRNNSLFAVN